MPQQSNCPSGWESDVCCSDFTSCAPCVGSTECGWCQSSSRCLPGSSSGPDPSSNMTCSASSVTQDGRSSSSTLALLAGHLPRDVEVTPAVIQEAKRAIETSSPWYYEYCECLAYSGHTCQQCTAVSLASTHAWIFLTFSLFVCRRAAVSATTRQVSSHYAWMGRSRGHPLLSPHVQRGILAIALILLQLLSSHLLFLLAHHRRCWRATPRTGILAWGPAHAPWAPLTPHLILM